MDQGPKKPKHTRKKKLKELLYKADASDLYMAYKGPQDKKEVSTKKYSRDFLFTISENCIDLPVGFQITSHIGEALMRVSIKVPPSDHEYGSLRTIADEEQAKLRKLKGILKKLTPENFERSFEQVKELNIDNVGTLTKAISKISDKVLTKLTSCEMYANFCERVASELPDLSVDKEKIAFRRLLLNKCKEDFVRGEREEQEAYNNVDAEGDAEEQSEVEHAGNLGGAVKPHSREIDRNVSRVVSQSGSSSKRSPSDADVTPSNVDGDEDRNSRLEGPKKNLKDEATKSESMSSQEEVSRLKAQTLALQAQIEQQQRRIDADIKLEELRFVNMKKKMETKMLITLIVKEAISAEDGELKKMLIKRFMADL